MLCVVGVDARSGEAAEVDRGVEPLPVEGKIGVPIRLPDGRLMAIHSEGKAYAVVIEDTETVEKAFARYSSDNGYTWSEPELLFEYPQSEGAYWSGATLCDRDGAIHLFGLHFFNGL